MIDIQVIGGYGDLRGMKLHEPIKLQLMIMIVFNEFGLL